MEAEMRIETAVGQVRNTLGNLLTHCLPAAVVPGMVPIGGKLNRARIVLSFAEIAGGIGSDALRIASGVEMLHYASLLQDDIIDQTVYRHGTFAVGHSHGIGTALLLSDWFFSQAYQFFYQSEISCLETMNRLVGVMAFGELTQELKPKSAHPDSVFRCLRYNYRKTALFFAVCCKIGVRAGTGSAAMSSVSERAAEKAGLWWGMAYQIGDDLQDLFPAEGEQGDGSDQDRRCGLFTLPLILLVKREPRLEKAVLTISLGELVRLFHKHGVINDCVAIRQRYLTKAEQQLMMLNPAGPVRDLLLMRLCKTKEKTAVP